MGKEQNEINLDLDYFQKRHIGPSQAQQKEMLNDLNFDSLDAFSTAVLPASIVEDSWSSDLEVPRTEAEALAELAGIAAKNGQVFKSYIGLGYYDTHTPPVIQRNLFENPSWYTQYTAYQAEISQGRLEALLNFQTMVTEITGLEVANASLLDEGTAAAEAMVMIESLADANENKYFFVSEDCFPQTIAIVVQRAKVRGIEVVVGNHKTFEPHSDCFGALLQYPGINGELDSYQRLAENLHKVGSKLVLAADLLALTILKTPAEIGADVAVGSTQRFGVPLGFGGPHAAYFAVKKEFVRKIPGRMVGVSRDREGKVAYRLALQTREQHIRRDKATSNICTSQVLLANMAGMFAVYHGPEGLTAIAEKVAAQASAFGRALVKGGYKLVFPKFFDTVLIECSDDSKRDSILLKAQEEFVNLRCVGEKCIALSFDQTVDDKDLFVLAKVFGLAKESLVYNSKQFSFSEEDRRKSPCLTHPIFSTHRSETQMMRYLKRLEKADISLTNSMIPLGSCTMKLNAAAELMPVSWPAFSKLHPFVPPEQATGCREMIADLEKWLCELTGFAGFSVQPNSGAQGEFAGLLVIRKYLEKRGESSRNICLIPSSAHGTNPASAIMAGMKIVVVRCDEQGNIDLKDLRDKAHKHSQDLAAMMVTYPSTHGVYEQGIVEICKIIHENGGQVYMDGANLNAQVGLCRAGLFGADVCHVNLHKTFCIPHGGGGPGVGPIGVAKHLVPFLPTHPLEKSLGETGVGPVAAAPWGSASILPISWMYMRMMGFEGLKMASQVAMLNANYLAKRLDSYFPVLYRGKNGLVAHECILDFRKFKKTANIEVEDVAKRLMDYGYHAPTMAWPVAGTLMIEPTESEDKTEIDRFCDAMIAIRKEIAEIEDGKMDRENNLLKNAPHTMMSILDDWNFPYSRKAAVFPLPYLEENKFWPKVSRVDNVYGDRNLICSCPSISDYE